MYKSADASRARFADSLCNDMILNWPLNWSPSKRIAGHECDKSHDANALNACNERWPISQRGFEGGKTLVECGNWISGMHARVSGVGVGLG